MTTFGEALALKESLIPQYRNRVKFRYNLELPWGERWWVEIDGKRYNGEPPQPDPELVEWDEWDQEQN